MGSLIADADEGCDKEIERSRREERLSLCNEGKANAKVISINLQLIDREIAISTDRGERSREKERERERERERGRERERERV
jgi:hypothetical protein